MRTNSAIGKQDGEKLRVLMIAPSLDMLGGQSRQCARLRGHLEGEASLSIGFQPVNPRLPGPLRKLQSIKYVRTFVTTLLYWAQLIWRAARYDILHVFSASYYSYLLSAVPAILLGRLYGKKVILNYRSGEAEDHLANWRWSAIPTMRLAHMIVVPSGYLVDLFARFNLKARAIYNIVELDRFKYRERVPLRPIFLTSRLLEPLYNVGCVLRAFALIQTRYPKASLTVAADGWMRRELEQFARDLQLQHTNFVGQTPFEQMPAMYDSADIYLTATNLDNMPSSITESMAAGLPVVTTNAGGIPYIATHEETCLMVECDDHEALAAAAMRFLEDNQLALRISRQARAAAQKFSWPAVRDSWIELYHELAMTNPASAMSTMDTAKNKQHAEPEPM